MARRNEPPIEFVSDSGRHFILIFERPEYRAYEIKGGSRVPMGLGAAIPDGLMKYIKEKY